MRLARPAMVRVPVARLPSFSTVYVRVKSVRPLRSFTLKKLECLKQAYALNTLAWNNNIGLDSYFVGF